MIRLDGQKFKMERTMPYSLAGDTDGDYQAWTPSKGIHVIEAIPYTDLKGGKAGKGLTIKFGVIDEASK